MRVLVACEYSGTVRNAFLERGHDAWSCDLLPSEDGSNRHIIGDARDLLNDGWDLLMVAHPPCTRLCNSGVRWLTVPPPGKTLEEMWAALDEGAALFSDFWNAPIERIAIENPVMHKHAKARIVAQIGRIIQARKLTQVQAAELLGIDQPKVSALLHGHFKGYSQERLVGFLTKLGMDVEIVVRPRAKKRQGEGAVSVVFA